MSLHWKVFVKLAPSMSVNLDKQRPGTGLPARLRAFFQKPSCIFVWECGMRMWTFRCAFLLITAPPTHCCVRGFLPLPGFSWPVCRGSNRMSYQDEELTQPPACCVVRLPKNLQMRLKWVIKTCLRLEKKNHVWDCDTCKENVCVRRKWCALHPCRD